MAKCDWPKCEEKGIVHCPNLNLARQTCSLDKSEEDEAKEGM